MKTSLLASAGLLWVCGLIQAKPTETRVWTDTQGRTVEARFLMAQNNEVRIQRSDHRIFQFPIRFLSPDDQLYIRRLLEREALRPSPKQP